MHRKCTDCHASTASALILAQKLRLDESSGWQLRVPPILKHQLNTDCMDTASALPTNLDLPSQVATTHQKLVRLNNFRTNHWG
jgi:hypothetical protein